MPFEADRLFEPKSLAEQIREANDRQIMDTIREIAGRMPDVVIRADPAEPERSQQRVRVQVRDASIRMANGAVIQVGDGEMTINPPPMPEVSGLEDPQAESVASEFQQLAQEYAYQGPPAARITASQIQDGSITAAQLAPGAVTFDFGQIDRELVAGLLGTTTVDELPTSGNYRPGNIVYARKGPDGPGVYRLSDDLNWESDDLNWESTSTPVKQACAVHNFAGGERCLGCGIEYDAFVKLVRECQHEFGVRFRPGIGAVGLNYCQKCNCTKELVAELARPVVAGDEAAREEMESLPVLEPITINEREI
jgi:hypothetical protein